MWQRMTGGTMLMRETSIPRRRGRLMAKVSIPGSCRDPSPFCQVGLAADRFKRLRFVAVDASVAGLLYRILTSPG